MMSPSSIEDAVKQSLMKVDPSMRIRPKQLLAIQSIMSGTDTLAILPTSYGKSMIFRLIPSICKVLDQQPNDAIVIVIVPLLSIVADQVEAANKLHNSLGLNACQLSSNEYENISNGIYNVIVGTPEAWLDSERWEAVISSDFFRNNLKCIVIDEVHKVSWGYRDENTGEAPFREAFSKISTLRSFCCEKVPVLALSATVTRDYCDLISMSCSLSSNFKLIVTCVDRPNIRLSCVNSPEKSVNCFDWVMKNVKELGVECPRVMIYCKAQLHVGWLYEQFRVGLKSFMFKDGIESMENAIVSMYHSDTLNHIKSHVLQQLTSDSGTVRVVICTSSLGCGVDCKNVKYVFHFGPPHNMIDYCQQIGRAGRADESDCHAVLYYFPGCLTKLVSPEMKAYTKTTTCLRKALFSPFNESEIFSKEPLHECCSNCALNCSCDSESCTSKFPFEIIPTKVFSCDDSDADEIALPPKQLKIDNIESSPQYEFEDSWDDLDDFDEDLAPE